MDLLLLAVLLTSVVSGGCQFDASGLSQTWPADADAQVTDADAQVTDAEAPPCTEGTRRCLVATLEECDAVGHWEVIEPCLLGCSSTEPRCSRLQPSNGIDPDWLDDGVDPFEPVTDVIVDTDTGTITPFSGQVVFRTTGPYACGLGGTFSLEAGVFIFTSIHIPADVTVRIRGPRAAVFLSAGPVLIEGIVDLSGGRDACQGAQPWCAGPGGFAGGLGRVEDPDPGDGPGGGGPGFSHSPISNDETGGGGGGYGGSGGPGGDDNDDPHVGGAAGTTYGSELVQPLCGGSGGGGGGGGVASNDSSHGGGGGGGFQLVSGTLVDLVCGTLPHCGIHAAGGGGQADHNIAYDDGGGGGGAGGAILVEAPEVSVGPDAVLAAGGGGGGGGYNGGSNCLDGQDGPLSDLRAAGGLGTYPGGSGGGGSVPFGDPGGSGHDGTAGGGGGAGWIRIHTYQPVVFEGLASPDAATTLMTFGSVQTD